MQGFRQKMTVGFQNFLYKFEILGGFTTFFKIKSFLQIEQKISSMGKVLDYPGYNPGYMKKL